ncbi:hypothetical protein C0995_005865 [Termitomyces sp. Mi166|nr:hypothetical protein C0995_005865 [Termitomyces sp. Mi166\
MAAFLQDSLAVFVLEGLLDKIEMMKRQHVTMLEHIEHAGKCKAPAYKEPMVEPKWARAPARQPQEFVRAPVPTAVQPPPLPVQPPSSSATLISVRLDSVLPRSSQELDILAVVENPLSELLLEPCDEIMTDAPAMQQEQRVEAPHAPPPLDVSKLDVMDFPDNVPAQAGSAQLLFMHTVSIPAPPPQFAVVVLTTDPRMLEQYNGLVATQQKTVAASKGKGKVVAMVDDESNYGQSSSEDEQELEEGESAAQRFQHMQ